MKRFSLMLQAQEYGEKNRFQDQIAWALQGVKEHGNTQYQALTILLSLFGNKRSRNVSHAMIFNEEVVPLISACTLNLLFFDGCPTVVLQNTIMFLIPLNCCIYSARWSERS